MQNIQTVLFIGKLTLDQHRFYKLNEKYIVLENNELSKQTFLK